MYTGIPGRLRTDDDLRWKDQFVWYYEVEKSGQAHLNDLYMHVWHWFQQNSFTHWQSNDKNIEDFYLHRIRPDGVQENLIWWRTKRKINNYIYYFNKMDWQVFGYKAGDHVYKGKKVKAGKLGVVIRVWWWLQIDPENRWEKSFLGRWGKWFFEHLLNQEMENHRDKILRIAKMQEAHIKQFFEMATWEQEPRTFFPEEGFKYTKTKPKPEDYEHIQRRPDHGLGE